MKVLLLGVGAQGKAALCDLVQSTSVEKVIAADINIEALEAFIQAKKFNEKVTCEFADVSNNEYLNHLLEQRPQIIIDLLPVKYHMRVIRTAIEHGVHLVNTSYRPPELERNHDQAKLNDVSILPEFGMDPGIDLVLLAEAVRSLDCVDEIVSYGAGFPEPEAANNPINYKVTWTFEGVLNSYRRAGRIIRDGKIIDIPSNKMFAPEFIHEIEIDSIGALEAFPNGDAFPYAELLGINPANLSNLGRYVLRWPGHCTFWQKLKDLHFLDEDPVQLGTVQVDRVQFLAAVVGPHIQYGDFERDIVIVRVEVKGKQDGKIVKNILQLIDRRNLETGFTAMSRTVGFTASIGAQMIATGQIKKRGVLSPLRDVPYELFVRELGKRNIVVKQYL